MSDPRPAIAIGYVQLPVVNVAMTTDFFVKLGIRTIVTQEDFAVLELRGGTHLVLRPWEEPEGALSRSISWWMTLTPLMRTSRAMAWMSRPSSVAVSTTFRGPDTGSSCLDDSLVARGRSSGLGWPP